MEPMTNVVTTEASSDEIQRILMIIETALAPHDVEIGALITAMFAYTALLQKPEIEPEDLIRTVEEVSKYMVFCLDDPTKTVVGDDGKTKMN